MTALQALGHIGPALGVAFLAGMLFCFLLFGGMPPSNDKGGPRGTRA